MGLKPVCVNCKALCNDDVLALPLFWVLTWSGIYPRNHYQMTKKKNQAAILLNPKMKIPELFKAYAIKIKAPFS